MEKAPFSRYISYQQFMDSLKDFQSSSNADDHLTMSLHGMVAYFHMLREFLHEKKSLNSVPHAEGYGGRLWDAWNVFANHNIQRGSAEFQSAVSYLANSFSWHFVHAFMSPFGGHLSCLNDITSDACQRRFSEISTNFDNGYFPFHFFPVDLCTKTGSALRTSFVDWYPLGYMLSMNQQRSKMEWLPLSAYPVLTERLVVQALPDVECRLVAV